MTPPQEARSDGDGCPSAEEIGAFLDGNLSPERTSRLLEHFASCEDCYQVYLGAESFLSQAGLAAQGAPPFPLAGSDEDQGRQPFSSRASDGTGPFRPRGRGKRWLLTLAAVLLVAASFPVYRSLTARPAMDATALVERSLAEGQQIGDLAWKGQTLRNLEGQSAEAFEVPFRLGVQVVNLQVGLKTEDPDLTMNAVQGIRRLIDKVTYLGSIDPIYEGIFKGMISNEEPFQPESFQDEALRAEQELEEILNPALFDLGRWTAAGRFAAISKNAGFFDSREVRRFPSWLLRQKEEPIESEVLTEVKAIRETLRRSPLTEEDYSALQARYKTILEIYYPGPDPMDPF